jgi:hypothetical protein
MPGRWIPRSEWEEFLEWFSLQHRGWRAFVEVWGVPASDRPKPVLLPLGVIALETGGTRIAISLRDGERSVRYRVIAPVLVLFRENEAGAHQGLRIQSSEGEITEVRFATPALPEMVDGII